jgi:hypothetical protein
MVQPVYFSDNLHKSYGKFMLNIILLNQKICDTHYRDLMVRFSSSFSAVEMALLNEIVEKFQFDNPIYVQALAQAVVQQSRFAPNANHIADEFYDEDEESTAICPHCLNPPVPPLRDYAMWREKNLSN